MTTPTALFRSSLEKLIAKFDADREHCLSRGYREAQARIDFITPLFEALGWDVQNKAGLAHHTREVLVERILGLQERRDDVSAAFRPHGKVSA